MSPYATYPDLGPFNPFFGRRGVEGDMNRNGKTPVVPDLATKGLEGPREVWRRGWDHRPSMTSPVHQGRVARGEKEDPAPGAPAPSPPPP